MGGSCEIKIPLPTRQVCDVGELYQGGCITYDFAHFDTTRECPAGYEEHANKEGCWRTETYDCSPPVQGKGVRGASVQVVKQTCERKEMVDMIESRFCPS